MCIHTSKENSNSNPKTPESGDTPLYSSKSLTYYSFYPAIPP
jgi:hypothetical protein